MQFVSLSLSLSPSFLMICSMITFRCCFSAHFSFVCLTSDSKHSMNFYQIFICFFFFCFEYLSSLMKNFTVSHYIFIFSRLTFVRCIFHTFFQLNLYLFCSVPFSKFLDGRNLILHFFFLNTLLSILGFLLLCFSVILSVCCDSVFFLNTAKQKKTILAATKYSDFFLAKSNACPHFKYYIYFLLHFSLYYQYLLFPSIDIYFSRVCFFFQTNSLTLNFWRIFKQIFLHHNGFFLFSIKVKIKYKYNIFGFQTIALYQKKKTNNFIFI